MIAMTIRWLTFLLCPTILASPCLAQPYPSRPIRLLVGFGAGGGTDMMARLYAARLQDLLHVPVVVENKPSALQLVAIQTAKAAPPDGYTLLFATGSALVQSPGIRKSVPFDTLKDLTPIAHVAEAAGVFYVNAAFPVRSMAALIQYAKANPGKVNYASAGMGAANHLQMEYLMHATGIRMVHVPYKSDSEVSQQVAAGTVQLGLSVPQFPSALAATGKVRMLAVTGTHRLAVLPEVPSLAETGLPELKDITNYTFYALLGPAGMPADIVARLNDAVNKVSKMPSTVEHLRTTLSVDPTVWSSGALQQYLSKELTKWKALGRALAIE